MYYVEKDVRGMAWCFYMSSQDDAPVILRLPWRALYDTDMLVGTPEHVEHLMEQLEAAVATDPLTAEEIEALFTAHPRLMRVPPVVDMDVTTPMRRRDEVTTEPGRPSVMSQDPIRPARVPGVRKVRL